MLLYLFICEFYFITFVVFAKHEQYNGHSLYEVNVADSNEMQIVNNLVKRFYLDTWTHASPGKAGHILVSKENKDVFEIALNSAGINYQITVQNIRDLLYLEDQQLRAAALRNQGLGFDIKFDMVYTYEEINRYLEYLGNTNSYVTLVTGGHSVYNRIIYYIKISTTNFTDEKKPVVMLQSLIHAREWSTSPVTLYAIHQLVVAKTEYDLLNNVDWIILPVANPDGYVYSHTTDRFWRKNRRFGFYMCGGVDINRNFDINWSIASSHDACAPEFHGTGPASEPETQAIANIVMMYKSRMLLYFDIHSFGSVILYGYCNGTKPKNEYEVQRTASMMAETIHNINPISVYPKYAVGNVAYIMSPVSGCAIDFAQAAGSTLSYGIELPAYKNHKLNVTGFLVDAEHIFQTCYETWMGIKVGVKSVLNLTGISLNATDLYHIYK